MVGNNLTDTQLQQLVDRTIIKADTDFDGKISFEEFCVVSLIKRVEKIRAMDRVSKMEKERCKLNIDYR